MSTKLMGLFMWVGLLIAGFQIYFIVGPLCNGVASTYWIRLFSKIQLYLLYTHINFFQMILLNTNISCLHQTKYLQNLIYSKCNQRERERETGN